MKTKFIIIGVILCNYLVNNFTILAQNGLPLVKNYSPEDYKGGIQNWGIAQDQRGVIYIANNLGLLQFDGNSWRSYIVSKALKIRSIAIHDDGKIFAGCQGDFGYFEADSIGTLAYHSLNNLVPKEFREIDETWKTYIINGSVYFCTFTKIYEYDGEKIEVFSADNTLDVSYTSQNKLYTQVPGKGIFEFDNEAFKEINFTDFFKDKIVSGLIALTEDELLITTSRDGIYLSDQYGTYIWKQNLNELFANSFINCAILLSNGNIALGTQHSGVYVVDREGQIVMHMDKRKGLRSHTILSLYEDQNNNLWVGQNNGISFIKLKSPFHLINDQIGLPGTGYTALVDQNKLYLGTNNGVYVSRGDSYQLIEGSEGQVYNIQSVDNQLIVSHNNGSFIIENNKASNFNKKQGTWMILPFLNTFLQGTYDGIEILDTENLSSIDKIKGLNESSRILVNESDSVVWMSHGYKGLYRINFKDKPIDQPEIEFYNENNQLPSDLFNAAHLVNDQLLITTAEGIYNYDKKQNRFDRDETLNQYFEDEQIITLKNDIYGNIYFITSSSVGLLEKLKNNQYKRHVSSFNPIRNLLNDDLPNISMISPNQVLFAAKEGFISFDRNLFWTTENEQFETIIRQVSYEGAQSGILNNGDSRIDGNENSIENYPEISYNNNTIAFNFSSTSYSATIVPEFQYKLLGYEREWSDWTESGFKEYTNLKEGFYTFQVKSRNASNVESKIVSYSFVIIYPWYRSPIAYIIYVLLAISVLVGIVLSIDKRHQMEKKRLEQKRLEEVTEKERELDKIAKESEGEINRLSKEKLESEIKHMDTELATNTMHLLNKNEFIHSIKSTLGGVVKKSTNDEVKKQINGIIKDINKNIETDGDWQNFQIHFEKVHGDFSTRLKQEFPTLSPQELKLSAYLRLNLSTKEIANLLHISMRGVEIGRYRLRKKLQLDRNQNLAKFILNY